MYKISKNVYYSCIFLVAVISLSGIAMACQVDEFYLTKAGFLASPSAERLEEANRYEKENNQEKLNDLLKNRIVLRLEDNVKVQALEWSIERKMIKIKFDGNGETYWVNDGALKQMKTDEKSEAK